VIDSDAAEASMELFKVVYSVFGKFTDSSKNDKFVMDEDMPSNVKLSGRRLPKGLKREFLIPALKERDPNNPDDFVVEGSEDEPVDVAEEFELNPEQQLKIQGDILHFCMQTIVELAGASRAVGRRQLLEMGALDTITKCLDANVLFEDRGLYGRFGKDDTSEVMKVRTTLMHEACSACHGFLAGRFGMHDMELDEEFDKPYKTLEAWKAEMAEDKDFESTKSFDGLGAVQRRKLHIVCAFLQLPHNSVGGIGNRSVVAGPVKNPDAPAPASKAEAVKEGAKSALSAVGGAIKGAVEKKVQPDWMQDDEDDIYKWCWAQTASASGANSNTMADQMISMHASETGLLKFHAVDLLLKIVEHDLDAEENRDRISEIFMETLKFDRNHHHALMGATGVHLIVQKKGLYRPYGERSQTLKGIELFRWAAKRVKMIMWWYLNSDGLPDFNSGDAGLEF